MEKEKLNKKQIIPLVIGVLTMIILVSSATYAYFKVSIGNTATSTTITGDIGGGTLGTVTLSGGGTNLYLGVSAYDMSESKKRTTYYSSTTEGSRETNLANAGKTTYTATLSGDETDEVMYACDYEFTVTASGDMLKKQNSAQLIFEGDINRTIVPSGVNKISGTWSGISYSDDKRNFNAYLKLENVNFNQNSLSGTNLSVEIKNTKWNCYLDERDVLFGEAYALYTESDKTLTFVRSETPIIVGNTHNDLEITAVYTGFEDEIYSGDTIPWKDNRSSITTVVFEDEIRPISTAHWFDSFKPETIDIKKLNTSNVTNMEGMFYAYRGTSLDLSSMDVSSVINMSYMFYNASSIKSVGNISSWDVSNVVDMEYMFSGFWSAVNLTELPINLSGWNVSKVAAYGKFSSSSTITPPVWKNVYYGIYSETDHSLRIYNLANENIPNEGDNFKGRVVTRLFNISTTVGSYPVRCSENTVPTSIIAEDIIIAPSKTKGWFKECTKVSYIDLTNLDTSHVFDMSEMFYHTGYAGYEMQIPTTIIGLENWDTSNVIDMSSMFYYMGYGYFLDLSGWDVSNVKYRSKFDSNSNIRNPRWKVS